jgi:hypothetical protein
MRVSKAGDEDGACLILVHVVVLVSGAEQPTAE